jgi:hypothetical protein
MGGCSAPKAGETVGAPDKEALGRHTPSLSFLRRFGALFRCRVEASPQVHQFAGRRSRLLSAKGAVLLAPYHAPPFACERESANRGCLHGSS